MTDSSNRSNRRNVVFYSRVTTDEEARLRLQMNGHDWRDEQKALHPEWNIVGSFADSGFLFERAKTRFEFHKMMELVPLGKFDLIVTRDVLEFASFASESYRLAQELAAMGIEIFFVTENLWTSDPNGMSILSYMASLSNEESKLRSKRIKAGQKISREKGVLYGSGNILGYDRTKDGKYKINEDQAATVRMIFSMYVFKRLGAIQIARELEKRERKTATGLSHWRADTVLFILGNSTYTGRQSGYLSDGDADSKTTAFRPLDFYPIISRDIFDAAQKIRSERVHIDNLDDLPHVKTIRKNPRQVWSRKLISTNCNSYTRGIWTKSPDGKPVEYGYFQNGARESDESVSVPEWRLEEMGEAVISFITDNLYDTASGIQKSIESKLEQSELENERSEKKQKLRKKLDTLLEMRLGEEITADEYTKAKVKIESEIRELESAATINSKKPVADSDAVSKLVIQINKTIKNSVSIHDAVDSLVSVIVPRDRSHFDWHIALDGGEIILQVISTGRKNKSVTTVSELT